jgi:leucyl aminopeptidase (aminopeptidase T)
MSTESAIHPGAEQIVRHCLGLEPDQHLVIFADETTVETAVTLAEAAESLGVSQTVVLVPVSVQCRIPRETDLSLLTQAAAREARAILTCVNSGPECLPFRTRILETHWTARTRIGHMPGASAEVLELADVDLQRLADDCRRMETAMVRGRELELVSYAQDGHAHSLKVDIGGWDRLPVASDGVISDGAWGNVPSGETYITPVEGSGEGSVVINGSVPGRVIGPDGEILLRFERGHLVHMEPEDHPVVRWLDETQIQRAQAAGDRNWSNLAEIGVGMNPAVEHLTGNMLFDEKAAGTAHVAVGTNTFMGGSVDSVIHCDMVTRQPSILIDGRVVLDRGRLRFVESEWHLRHAAVSLDESPLRTASRVASSGIQVVWSGDGRLQRVLRPEPGRVSACTIGDDETSRLAGDLYALLPVEGGWIGVDRLANRARLDSEITRRVLHVMREYGVIRVRQKDLVRQEDLSDLGLQRPGFGRIV